MTVQPREPLLPGAGQLRQFVVRCEAEEDKFLLLYALLKLALLRGRALLFVSSLSRCYRLKLFLEQFGIAACALNSELPARSRYGGGGMGWGEKGEGRDGNGSVEAGMGVQELVHRDGGKEVEAGMGAQG